VQLAQRWGEDYASSSALPETEAQAAPAGSLVERVYDAMVLAAAGSEARAAIREVAAWFRRGDAGAGSAWTVAADVLDAVLEREANRG
jgi:hypothetical protein